MPPVSSSALSIALSRGNDLTNAYQSQFKKLSGFAFAASGAGGAYAVHRDKGQAVYAPPLDAPGTGLPFFEAPGYRRY